MLRFNNKKGGLKGVGIKFQYILCYGSTHSENADAYSEWRISIHPMLRFNLEDTNKINNNIRFQYILCYGSTAFSSRKK